MNDQELDNLYAKKCLNSDLKLKSSLSFTAIYLEEQETMNPLKITGNLWKISCSIKSSKIPKRNTLKNPS